ncbi:LysM peptidoglycan-binding domain-containing protein [bacterium]|nr:LysM peptidoglycan-binding domain-containing protein [bacterium]
MSDSSSMMTESTPVDQSMRAEDALEAAPRYMREGEDALAQGDSSAADAAMMQAIMTLQGVILDVPADAQPSMLDTLTQWTQSYEDRFDTTIEDLIATDEGLSALIADQSDTLSPDSLLEELSVDSFEVVLDTTIVEVDALPGIPDTVNAKVERMLTYFTENPRGRKAMTIWLERAGAMIPRMTPILRQHGVPEDLVYLSMIESGFRNDARSWARAVGPWQFIYSTGKTFDLEADWWYDERRDPELATHAASRFLRQLYEHLGDWYLALSAYNCGEGRVRREIRRSGGRDFWNMRRLPSQTRNYVPTFLAARKIASDPEAYGFAPIDFKAHTPRDTVYVDEPIELNAIAEALEIEAKVLRDLNPALLRWCTPPNRTKAMLFVPDGFSARFDDAIASIPAEKKTSWVRHRVRSGETLSVIASKYGSSMRAIMDVPANDIKNPNRITVGDYLLIPVAPGGKYGDYAALYAMNDPELPDGMQRRIHRVRSGETLSQIAERYHLGLSKLLRWNNLHKRSVIYPGQKLVLYQPADLRRPGSTKSSKSAVAPSPISYEGKYRVRRGDSAWSIAQAHGVSTADLLTANKLTSRSTLHPGDMLQVPLRSTPEGAIVYQVQRGDTLWEIATRFDVSVTDLKTWNNIRDARALRAGDKLIVRIQQGSQG